MFLPVVARLVIAALPTFCAYRGAVENAEQLAVRKLPIESVKSVVADILTGNLQLIAIRTMVFAVPNCIAIMISTDVTVHSFQRNSGVALSEGVALGGLKSFAKSGRGGIVAAACKVQS